MRDTSGPWIFSAGFQRGLHSDGVEKRNRKGGMLQVSRGGGCPQYFAGEGERFLLNASDGFHRRPSDIC